MADQSKTPVFVLCILQFTTKSLESLSLSEKKKLSNIYFGMVSMVLSLERGKGGGGGGGGEGSRLRGK